MIQPGGQSSQNAEQLAKRFLEATIDQSVTDKDAVYDILKEVDHNCLRWPFERAVYQKLNPEGHKTFLFKGEKYVVPLIISNKFSGPEFVKAMNLFDGRNDSKTGPMDGKGNIIRGVIEFLSPPFGRLLSSIQKSERVEASARAYIWCAAI